MLAFLLSMCPVMERQPEGNEWPQFSLNSDLEEGAGTKAQLIADNVTDVQGCEGVQELSKISIRTEPF